MTDRQCPEEQSVPRKTHGSNPIGRCSTWIQATRWRGLFYLWILALNGRADAVAAVLEGFSPVERDTVPARVAQFLAHALFHGQDDTLPTVTSDIEAVAMASDVFARFLAEGYAVAGVPDRALHWLAIAIDRGFINYPFLARYDPCFETLRSRPQFQHLLRAVRQRWLSFET